MRAATLLLPALLVFAPVLRAGSCSCEHGSVSEATPACCCGDGACRCPGCERHGTDAPERTLAGCVCTKSSPQVSPEPEHEFGAPPPAGRIDVVLETVPASAESVAARETAAGPPAFRPLLL